MKPGGSCSLQTAPQQPVIAASFSDSELEETHEAEEAAQGHPCRELLNESFPFKEPEQLIDEYGIQEAAQPNTELVVERSYELEDVWIAYRKYIQTRQRILTI